MPLPPTGFRYQPDLGEPHMEPMTGGDPAVPYVPDERTVEGIDIIVFRPLREGEAVRKLKDIAFGGQPIYVEGPAGDLRPPSFTTTMRRPPHIQDASSLRSMVHLCCPVCHGKGTTWTVMSFAHGQEESHRDGCLVCGRTYEQGRPWHVIGHHEPTGFEWVRWCGETEAECQKVIDRKSFGVYEGVTYRVEANVRAGRPT